MMNKEMVHRMKIAREYQKKAILALFPQEMGKHLDVIENELKMMMGETVTELLKRHNTCNDFGEKQSHEQKSKVKKVNIG